MIEIWKPIPGYSYEASSHGRVRNKWGKVLKTQMKQKYHWVNVRADSEKYGRTRRVHRLVAMAFHGLPPEDKPMALHRDDVQSNNTPENLYWGDALDNHVDAKRNGKFFSVASKTSR
jgi:hypothetical protein